MILFNFFIYIFCWFKFVFWVLKKCVEILGLIRNVMFLVSIWRVKIWLRCLYFFLSRGIGFLMNFSKFLINGIVEFIIGGRLCCFWFYVRMKWFIMVVMMSDLSSIIILDLLNMVDFLIGVFCIFVFFIVFNKVCYLLVR